MLIRKVSCLVLRLFFRDLKIIPCNQGVVRNPGGQFLCETTCQNLYGGILIRRFLELAGQV